MIEEIVVALRRDVAALSEPASRAEAAAAKLAELVAGQDLSTLLANDPPAAAALMSKVSWVQAELVFAETITKAALARANKHAPEVVRVTRQLISEVRRLMAANLKARVDMAVEKLRATGLFEEERLPRLVGEAVVVRLERHWNLQFEVLGDGGGAEYLDFSDGTERTRFHNLNAGAILGAYDAAVAALEAVKARAAEIASEHVGTAKTGFGMVETAVAAITGRERGARVK